ncbi:hypothetical protein [Motilimonas sp. KMU-193]|uniref:hypothetical protein n=1 Tax=Motilimonas sp. KMU-193 TaxID=3388668 RepID=UPI00396B22D6
MFKLAKLVIASALCLSGQQVYANTTPGQFSQTEELSASNINSGRADSMDDKLEQIITLLAERQAQGEAAPAVAPFKVKSSGSRGKPGRKP